MRHQNQTRSNSEIDKWMQEHQGEMIYCQRQPGLLMITKKACLKRYRAAQAKIFESVSQEDPFHYALKKGLDICEGCPIGMKLDKEERAGSKEKTRQSLSA
jgi:hypothetical protein